MSTLVNKFTKWWRKMHRGIKSIKVIKADQGDNNLIVALLFHPKAKRDKYRVGVYRSLSTTQFQTLKIYNDLNRPQSMRRYKQILEDF